MSGITIGMKAPEFTAQAACISDIIENFSLSQFLGKKVVFFFYPLDFTFVCPTELIAFQRRLADFHARNTEVVGCSVDSVYSHLAWLRTPLEDGGITGVTYPLVSDLKKEISSRFGVLSPQGIAWRGLFLLDEEGVIRHFVVNDLPLGRNVDEALRVVDALTFVQKHGEVCPANWKTGEKGMTASKEGVEKYFMASIDV